MEKTNNQTLSRRLCFSLDRDSRKKFLLFLDSIICFSSDECCVTFSFTKKEIICVIVKEHKHNYIAFLIYDIICQKEEIENNSFKTYFLETARNNIRLIIDNVNIIKFKKILKEIPNAEEYIFTAKKRSDNTCYFNVDIQLGGLEDLTFKEVIDFQPLKINNNCELFDMEACFHISFLHNHNFSYLLSFMEMSLKDKLKNYYSKIIISYDSENIEDSQKGYVSFSLPDNSEIIFPVDFENNHNFEEKYKMFYIETYEFHKLLNSHKSALNFGMFLDFNMKKMYTNFAFNENKNCHLKYHLLSYGVLNLELEIKENF